MRFWMAISFVVALVTCSAVAKDAPLRGLNSESEATAWRAVGRLNIGSSSFCTGTLIASDIVLTAGHCLFDKATGTRVSDSDIEFLAGWRSGRASAHRTVRRALVHPDFAFDTEFSTGVMINDLALLELEYPILDEQIAPFATAERPRRGAQVGVVSYGAGRSEAPALQETCRVLAQQNGVLVTSCTVDFGSSGAPIFVINGGVPQIVSIVSAKAEVEGEAVSLGTSLGRPLVQLQEALLVEQFALRPRLRAGQISNQSGATFVKP